MNTTIAPTSLRLTRLIKAPRARVFAAWITPAEISQWLCPGPVRMLSATIDARAGGAYCFRLQKGDQGESEKHGVYREVSPPRKLVFTWGGGGCGTIPEGEETLVTVEFADKNGATELTITHERFPNAESCDQHEQGWMACIDKLEQFFSR